MEKQGFCVEHYTEGLLAEALIIIRHACFTRIACRPEKEQTFLSYSKIAARWECCSLSHLSSILWNMFKPFDPHTCSLMRIPLHQVVARKLLKTYCIGELVGTDQAPLLKDFHAMKHSFAEQGLLDANPIYYTRKCLELVGMVSASLYLLFAYSSSLPALLASSLLMAIFIFQCGWTCHDFHHNQFRLPSDCATLKPANPTGYYAKN
eukprot:1160218-Pelagomonas_calceolata.AAC.4